MRRINIFVIIGIIITFIFHAVSGSIRLFGADAGSAQLSARLCMFLVLVHVIITTILTVRTLLTIKKSGRGYFRENLLFWARRISGFALLIPLVMHLFVFSGTGDEAYRLVLFNSGRLISQILLAAVLAFHILTNIHPFLVGIGVKEHKIISADMLFVVSVFLLFCCSAFCVYYLRWMAY